jgi:hypothetical protein
LRESGAEEKYKRCQESLQGSFLVLISVD